MTESEMQAIGEKVAAMLASRTQTAPAMPAAFPTPAGWPAPPMMGGSQPIGVSIPIKVQLPDGSTLRMYLAFGAEAATPQNLMMLVQQLAAVWPLDVYTPRPQFGQGFNGGSGRNWGRRW